MVDTMCEVLNYIVPTIVLALDLRGLSMCSECIVKLYTVKKVWENNGSQSFSAGGLE